MSAFYIVACASLSLPAILACARVEPLGLRPTFELLGGAVAALQAWRTRPRVGGSVVAA
jgi:hypothetical protein